VYTLTASTPGRVPATLESVRVGSTGLRFVLRRGLSVSGRVVGPDGRPVAGLPLVALPPGSGAGMGWDGVQEATSDDAGRFSVSGFAAGPVRLRVNVSRSDGTRTLGEADTFAGATDVELRVEVHRY
jgi:hypothetical protein